MAQSGVQFFDNMAGLIGYFEWKPRFFEGRFAVEIIEDVLEKMAIFGSWFFGTPVAISLFLFLIAVFGFWMAWELFQIRKELKKFGKNEKEKGE